IGGFTFAYVPPRAAAAGSRWPMVTPRREATLGNAAALVSAPSGALRAGRGSRVTLEPPVSWGGDDATAHARRPAGGRAAGALGGRGRALSAKRPSGRSACRR